MSLNQLLIWACCAVVVVCCTLAVLHPQFDDNLAQRAGLSVMALAMLGVAAQGQWSPAEELAVIGLALYCAGTAFKFVKRRRAEALGFGK